MRCRLHVTCAFVVGAVLGCAAPAFSDPILITSGFLEVEGRTPANFNEMRFFGSRGFSFEGTGLLGNFGPEDECLLGCQPGQAVDLFAAWSGGDLVGTATLDGANYQVNGNSVSANVEFTGSLVLPPFDGDAAVLTAPFGFTGLFIVEAQGGNPHIAETLRGSGTVTTTWARELDPDGGTGWFLDVALYEFAAPIPEPTTVTMLALGGAVLALRRRRSKEVRGR